MNLRAVAGRPVLDLVERPCPTCGGRREQVVARGIDYEYRSCANVFTFVECLECGTVYLNPRPRREDLPVIYPRSYYSALEASGRGGAGPLVRAAWDRVELHRIGRLRELLGPGPRHVLDIGCGDGRLLRLLHRVGGRRWSLLGVEQGLPRRVIEQAGREGITIHEGLYEQTPFPPGGFDLVVAQQVIEHALEPTLLVAKALRELKPGGFLVLDTPDCSGTDGKLSFAGLWGGYHFPRHMTLFTPDTLERLARSAGFEVISTERLASPVFWVMTFHNAAVAAGLPSWMTSRLTYRSVALLAIGTLLEVPALAGLRRSSNMRMVLRRPGRPGTP